MIMLVYIVAVCLYPYPQPYHACIQLQCMRVVAYFSVPTTIPTHSAQVVASCPDPTTRGEGLVTQARFLGLAEALKPCNCRCINANWKMNLIIVPSHGRNNAAS